MAQQDVSNVRVSIESLGITGTTDSNGNCSFEVPPGTYNVKFEHDDYETKTVISVVGNSGKNEEVEMIHKPIAPADPYAFTGKAIVLVRDDNNNPISGATVKLTLEGYYDQTLTSGNDGKCIFTDTPISAFDASSVAMRCSCTKENYTSLYPTIQSNSSSSSSYDQVQYITLQAKYYRVLVQDRDNDYAPVQGIPVKIVSDNNVSHDSTTDSEGYAYFYEFENNVNHTVYVNSISEFNSSTNGYYWEGQTTRTLTHNNSTSTIYLNRCVIEIFIHVNNSGEGGEGSTIEIYRGSEATGSQIPNSPVTANSEGYAYCQIDRKEDCSAFTLVGNKEGYDTGKVTWTKGIVNYKVGTVWINLPALDKNLYIHVDFSNILSDYHGMDIRDGKTHVILKDSSNNIVTLSGGTDNYADGLMYHQLQAHTAGVWQNESMKKHFLPFSCVIPKTGGTYTITIEREGFYGFHHTFNIQLDDINAGACLYFTLTLTSNDLNENNYGTYLVKYVDGTTNNPALLNYCGPRALYDRAGITANNESSYSTTSFYRPGSFCYLKKERYFGIDGPGYRAYDIIHAPYISSGTLKIGPQDGYQEEYYAKYIPVQNTLGTTQPKVLTATLTRSNPFILWETDKR